MATSYTSLLGLALPANGDTNWGTTINDSMTTLVDSAVAGTTTLSSDADVTLTTTTGTANQSRQPIILWTAGGTATRYITAPAASKPYIVINKTSSTQSIVLRGVGPTTGITIAANESCVAAWNGSDFEKVSSSTGAILTANNTFTGANNFYNSTGQTFGTATSTQDGIVLAGRAGGSSSYRSTIQPGTLSANRTITLPDATTTVTGTDATQTLTNKRIDPRVTSAASASSLTPDVGVADMYAYTALAAGLTINAPTGTPVDGQRLMFRILDNGTSRSLTWNATFTSVGFNLPSSTTANKTIYVGCIYNANNTRWDVVAVVIQA